MSNMQYVLYKILLLSSAVAGAYNFRGFTDVRIQIHREIRDI